VTVAWQGVHKTFQPTAPLRGINCGVNLYPDELQRRVVKATLRIGALKAQ
jgi:hypothetical protein